LALRTTRVKLGTAVLVLPYRHPVYTAKALATVDMLSGGRLLVGVGAGWMEPEFAAFGVPLAERGSRTSETIDVLKVLWTEETASYAGRHFQFNDVKFVPQPVQKPWPPILVGGMTDGALRRVVRQGDGWIAIGKSPDDLRQPLGKIKELAAKAGRNFSELHISMLPIGAPGIDNVIDDLPRYADAGVHHLYLSMRAWTTEFSQFMELMGRFARAAGIGGQ
jgi:probable F420-dependent oxidoreductase